MIHFRAMCSCQVFGVACARKPTYIYRIPCCNYYIEPRMEVGEGKRAECFPVQPHSQILRLHPEIGCLMCLDDSTSIQQVPSAANTCIELMEDTKNRGQKPPKPQYLFSESRKCVQTYKGPQRNTMKFRLNFYSRPLLARFVRAGKWQHQMQFS